MSSPPKERSIEVDWSATGTEKETVSEAVIRTVAVRANKSPRELPPLYDSVDPDALDILFEPTADRSRFGGEVRFPFAGYRVRVSTRSPVAVESVDEDVS